MHIQEFRHIPVLIQEEAGIERMFPLGTNASRGVRSGSALMFGRVHGSVLFCLVHKVYVLRYAIRRFF